MKSPAANPANYVISQAEYRQRREQLMQQMEANSIAVVPASHEMVRNRDAEFPFRQSSDFFYLTGFNEPDAVLVLIPGREHGEYVLFCRERDREMELWNGYRAGPEGVCESYGADDAFPITDIDDILPGLLEGKNRVYYSLGKDANFDSRFMEWVNSIRAKVRTGAVPPEEFIDLDHFLHDLRLFKSDAEIDIMARAGDISAAAHCRAMRACQPGLYEFSLEAEIQHEFGCQGARFAAYSSIVGGGHNACILHYTENADALQDGDLVLIDAGCELHCYAADITRTFPVNGRFNDEQKALYQLVLDAQLAAIAQVAPGKHWNDPHEAAVKVITAGLIKLELLSGDLQQLIDDEAYKPFYMHRTGHWLGLDVHDVGDYKVAGQWRVLEPGMVLTVEPGLYVAVDNDKVDARWRGIGIRIEDDVVVTETGCRVLTDGVPKTVAAIEALMAEGE